MIQLIWWYNVIILVFMISYLIIRNEWCLKISDFIEDLKRVEFKYKNCKNYYPETYYNFMVIEINYINTSQVRSLNVTILNRLFQIFYEK